MAPGDRQRPCWSFTEDRQWSRGALRKNWDDSQQLSWYLEVRTDGWNAVDEYRGDELMPYQEVLHKFKHGALHSGSKHGPKVTNRKQAIAIMLSEKREGTHEGSMAGLKKAAK